MTIRIVILILIGVVIVFLSATVPFYFFGVPKTPSEFGESFGFLNAIVSSFAFFGLIMTLMMQRTELALQREELTNTREELHRSADAQKQMEQLHFVSAYLTMLNIQIQNEQQRLEPLKNLDPQSASLFHFTRRKDEFLFELQTVLERLKPNTEAAMPPVPPLVALDGALSTMWHLLMQSTGLRFAQLMHVANWTVYQLKGWQRILPAPESSEVATFTHSSFHQLLDATQELIQALPGWGLHEERTHAAVGLVTKTMELVQSITADRDRFFPGGEEKVSGTKSSL